MSIEKNESTCQYCIYKKKEKNIFGKERDWCSFSEKHLANDQICVQFTSCADVSVGKLMYFTFIEQERPLSEEEKELQTRLKALRDTDSSTYANLGDYYMNRFNDPESNRFAFYYYKTAADKGHITAKYNTALCYLNGRGVTKDEKKLIKYMSDAAWCGHWPAAYWLGYYYQQNNDISSAKLFYKISAKKGHAGSQYFLAEIYIQEWTKGNKKSFDKGLFWYECAYLHGNNDIQFSEKAREQINLFIQHGYPQESVERGLRHIQQTNSPHIINPSY